METRRSTHAPNDKQFCEYLTYKEWKHAAAALGEGIPAVSTLPIRNGNLEVVRPTKVELRQLVSTLPIRNGSGTIINAICQKQDL